MCNLKRHLRGAWISTVLNLDWPSKNSLSLTDANERVNQQKSELIRLLDDAVNLRLNAVFFQVKPACDAFYQSTMLPWSAYLTGTLGKDPGYDPLQFVIDQAHQRNLELHAWFNPYRVSMNTLPATIDAMSNVPLGSPASVYAAHPEWVGTASRRFVLDPGIPAASAWMIESVMEVAQNYDVDGIHFDDYFYYETAESALDDSASFSLYANGVSSKAQWRRNNITQMITDLSQQLRTLKPHIKFGVSPAGVWRNKADDERGTDTRAGSPTYDKQYADTRQWVIDELIDYIAPQVYWPMTRTIVPYDAITQWWATLVNNKNVHLYIGVALYKVGQPSTTEPQWTLGNGATEISEQLTWNGTLQGIHGSVLFRMGFTRNPVTSNAITAIENTVWPTVALVPCMPWKGTRAPAPPIQLHHCVTPVGVHLQWGDGDSQNTVYYAVYKLLSHHPVANDRAECLVATIRRTGPTQCWVDASGAPAQGLRYLVTALDRNHNESDVTMWCIM